MNRRIERADFGEPTTPLGVLAKQMSDLIERDSIKAIIMLVDYENKEAMSSTHNYDPESREAIVDLLTHLQALAAGSGMRLDFMTMDEDGVSKVEGFEAWRGPA